MRLSEESILKLLHEKTSRPMKMVDLVKCLSIPEEQRHEFREWIKQMEENGRLVKIRGNRYGLPEEMNLTPGTIQGHANGFGFLVPDKPGEGDIYISRRNMADAMHRDRVVIRIEAHRGYERPEGRVIRILERKTTALVGVYEPLDSNGWVTPSESKYFHTIFIASKNRNGAKKGHLVSVEILEYPTRNTPPTGKVVEILGYSNDPDAEIRSIIHGRGFHTEFPYEVTREAKRLSAQLEPEERSLRRDLTGWTIFTIDGEKAKDFDDAVSIEKTASGYKLGVHIADVSHYVQEGSELDKEAFERGTSVYFPDGVIPMLPVELSNEICSLKPHVERPTVSVLIDFDEAGETRGYEIFDSVIKSRRRFTYTEVARLFEEKEPDGEYADTLPGLKVMLTLSRILRQRRFQNGSVDFNLPEAEIQMDKEGRVTAIAAAVHNDAHKLIEEFMLAANQTVAKHLAAHNISNIHRIHEAPAPEKLEALNEFLKSFGMKLQHVHDVKPGDLQKILKKIAGQPGERVINTLLLRSMKKALYSESDPGHFCLAFEHYTHFTSPIRRYPDLITHRVLKTYLHRKCGDRERKKLKSRIAECAEQSSLMEIKAMEVERAINDLRRAQFMLDKIGKVYSGVISSVTAFGFFVALDEIFVEGLVHVSSLTDDYYLYLEYEHKLKGQHRQRVYKIGDPVKIRVAKVDLAKRQIDFALATTR